MNTLADNYYVRRWYFFLNGAIIICIGGVALFAGLWLWLWFTPPHRYTDNELFVVEGVLTNVEEVNIRQGTGTLQLTLQNVPLPFRSSGPYPKLYDQDALKQLRPGTAVTIKSPRAQQAAPKKDHSQNQEFRELCSLAVGRRSLLTLGRYNEWHTSNHNLGKLVVPILFFTSIGGILAALFGKHLTAKRLQSLQYNANQL